MRTWLALIALLIVLPGWDGEQRLGLLGRDTAIDTTPVTFDPGDPARIRTGRLSFLGGVALTNDDPTFGGFSALRVQGDRFTLLSDGGNIVRFAMGADRRPHGIAFAHLPAGPRTGWDKGDRDSESMTLDPVTKRIWVGFENAGAIWRYAPGFARAEALVAPREMADWDPNGGPESLARMPDGRFVTISETSHVPPRAWGRQPGRLHSRDAVIFSGDPTRPGARRARFAYLPFGRYDPSDAAALPNGDLVVLDRAFALPFHWSNRVSIVPAAQIGAGRIARGRLLATLDAPLIHDNFEGVAVTREGRDTILWLVSDDNQMPLQRSLLLKFRLAE